MKPAGALTVSVCLALAACAGGGDGGGDGATDGLYASAVRHSYFPLTEGAHWVFEGEEEGLPRREDVRVLPGRRRIGNADCTALTQDVTVDGVLVETTTEWFAQDRAGNVWKLGEESSEFDEVGFVTTTDSWLAGEDGGRPYLAFPAQLRVGDVFYGYRPDGSEEFRVLSLTDSVDLPAGTFAGCLRLWENPLDVEDADILLYAPGIGRVSEDSTTGFVHLVSMAVP
jgi:hypothetical protein